MSEIAHQGSLQKAPFCISGLLDAATSFVDDQQRENVVSSQAYESQSVLFDSFIHVALDDETPKRLEMSPRPSVMIIDGSRPIPLSFSFENRACQDDPASFVVLGADQFSHVALPSVACVETPTVTACDMAFYCLRIGQKPTATTSRGSTTWD